jgi:hypothetical protein
MSKKKTPEDFFAKFAPPLEDQHFSLGYCCMMFSVNPNQLDLLMSEAGVRFTRVVDGVLYLDGHVMQKLTATYNGIVGEINSATESAVNN